MARQANGTYLQPANTAAVSGQTISSTAYNTLITDIGSEITNSLDRLGRSAMSAALPMGGQKITGMADPTVATDGATKNYVDTSTAAFFSTGDVKITIKNVADTGWILCDDGTFGSASSGGTSRANADTQPLFNLLFNNTVDANVPIYTSGGSLTTRAAQTNAATAWAANCRMSLPRVLGRALAVAGAGSGLTSRPLCTWNGEEAHLLVASEIPTITSSGSATLSASVTSVNFVASNSSDSTAVSATAGGAALGVAAGGGSSVSHISSTGTASGAVALTSNNTGGATHNNMQPSAFFNVMVKL